MGKKSFTRLSQCGLVACVYVASNNSHLVESLRQTAILKIGRSAYLNQYILSIFQSASSFKGAGFLLAGVIAITAAGAAFHLRETKGNALLETIEETEDLKSTSTIDSIKELFSLPRFRGRMGECDQEMAIQARAPTVPVLMQSPSVFSHRETTIGKNK